jgi:hypothetical protein
MTPPDRVESWPTAQQSELLGQETLSRNPMPLGRVWSAQICPPFVVATMTPPELE